MIYLTLWYCLQFDRWIDILWFLLLLTS